MESEFRLSYTESFVFEVTSDGVGGGNWSLPSPPLFSVKVSAESFGWSLHPSVVYEPVLLCGHLFHILGLVYVKQCVLGGNCSVQV